MYCFSNQAGRSACCSLFTPSLHSVRGYLNPSDLVIYVQQSTVYKSPIVHQQCPQPSQRPFSPSYHYVLIKSAKIKPRTSKILTQTKRMRQSLFTNNHRRTPLLPPLNNLIPRLLRHPMIIPTKVKEQLRNRFMRTPNIITPFVRGDSTHFISSHMSTRRQQGSQTPISRSRFRRRKKERKNIQSLSHTTPTPQERARSV